MRRDELIAAIHSVINAIKESRSNDILERNTGGSRDEKKDTPADVLHGYAKYMYSFSSFGENEKKIIEIFGLQRLSSAKFWSEVSKTRPVDEWQSLFFATKYLPKFAALLRRNVESDEVFIREDKKQEPDRIEENRGALLRLLERRL